MAKGKIKRVEDKKGSHIKTHEARSLSTDNLTPAFCLTHLDKEYCFTKCEDKEKLALIERMHVLSELTWQKIKQQDRKKLGCEPIEHSSLSRPIPKHLTPDVTILSFRFNSRDARMVGYREYNIFHIIWLDTKLTLYKH